MRPPTITYRRKPSLSALLFLTVLATLMMMSLVFLRLLPRIEAHKTRELRKTSVIFEEAYPELPHVRASRPVEPSDAHSTAPRIALVIDDLGNRWNSEEVRGLLTLENPITFGVIPGLGYSNRIARAAHDNDKEVIAHVPMKPVRGDVGLGIPVINPGDGEEAILRKLAPAFELPHASGVNNHMGSLATSDRETMARLVRVLGGRGWFVLDSITLPSSVLYEEAVRAGLPATKRDVFLDHVMGRESVLSALKQAENLALALDRPVVVIGHPRPDTWAVLREQIPILENRGIRFVLLSEAVNSLNNR